MLVKYKYLTINILTCDDFLYLFFVRQTISKLWCVVVFTKVSSTPQEKWCYKHLHLIALWGISNQSHYFTNLNINFLLRTTIHIYHNIMLMMRRETSHFHLITNEACFKSENWLCNEALFSLQNIFLLLLCPLKMKALQYLVRGGFCYLFVNG